MTSQIYIFLPVSWIWLRVKNLKLESHHLTIWNRNVVNAVHPVSIDAIWVCRTFQRIVHYWPTWNWNVKRWISRPCVSLKYFNLILIHLAESRPGYTGKGHANPQVEMSEVYFYIVVMNFAFKAKQIMYKVWLASVPTYGEIDNPYRHARVAEPWGNRKWSVTWIFLNIQISAIK